MCVCLAFIGEAPCDANRVEEDERTMMMEAPAFSPVNNKAVLFAGHKRISPSRTQNTKAIKPRLDELVARADEVTNWSLQLGLDSVNVTSSLYGELDGKKFLLTSEHTGDDFKRTPKGKEEPREYDYYNCHYGEQDGEGKAWQVDVVKRTYDRVMDKLMKVAQPKIEAAIGAGNDLDITGVLLDLAQKTAQGLKWEEKSDQPKPTGIGEALGQALEKVFKPQGAITARELDGTRYTITLQSTGFLGASAYFLTVQKPEQPPQTVIIGSDREKEAFELFNKVAETFEEENKIHGEIKQIFAELEKRYLRLEELPKHRNAYSITAYGMRRGLESAQADGQ